MKKIWALLFAAMFVISVASPAFAYHHRRHHRDHRDHGPVIGIGIVL
jgi:hypothetical protein